MNKDMQLGDFLSRNRIDTETWGNADIEWEVLKEIAHDHDAASENLEDSAQLFAKVIQKFPGVHSVRWRVKDTEHLLAKIVRKRSEKNVKYADISPKNYFELVTDLVGVRALHLFKDDCFSIDGAIKQVWSPEENPVAYIREGDSEALRQKFLDAGFDIQNHKAGYRSVHYVIKSIPLKRPIFAEIQVRTIFEEGWSEIDHRVRYPNFSENLLVQYFLEIFNRMAGSADDMGGFVLGLVATLDQLKREILAISLEKEASLEEKERILSQLEKVKKQDDASKQSIAMLKREITALKREKDGSSLNVSSLSPKLGLLGAAAGLDPAVYQRLKQELSNSGGLLSSSVLETLRRGLPNSVDFDDALRLSPNVGALGQIKHDLANSTRLANALRGLDDARPESNSNKGLLGDASTNAGSGGLLDVTKGSSSKSGGKKG